MQLSLGAGRLGWRFVDYPAQHVYPGLGKDVISLVLVKIGNRSELHFKNVRDNQVPVFKFPRTDDASTMRLVTPAYMD